MKRKSLVLEVNSERWLSLEDLPYEEWRDIKGFSGIYQVSNYGRVKSLRRLVDYRARSGKDSQRIQYERILFEHDNGNGYLWVDLWLKNKSKHHYVHRLVAETFIQNSQKLPQINHKDENKSNNNVNNLEWCTCLYNVNYGTARDRCNKTRVKHGLCRSIDMYDLNGNFIKTYEIANHIGLDGYNRRAVYNTARGRCKSYKGMVFRFHGEKFSYNINKKRKSKRKVFKYDLNNVLVETYSSIKDAERNNNFNRNYLYSATYAGSRVAIANNYKFSFEPIQ